MSNKNVKPFGMSDKLGYMFGDFGNDFTFILSSMMLMKFYSDVMGVDTAIIGLMMTAARFVDAVSDVTMGQIVDRSKPTKDGKFKPWLRRMCGPVAVASLLMYAPWVGSFPMVGRIVWMFVTYIMWGSIFYTSINIPYGSMASAISGEPKDRAELSTFRTIGASLAGTAIGVVLPLVVYTVDANGNQVLDGTKMFIGAVLCSVGAVACYLISFNMCTERVKVEQKTEKFDVGKLIKGLVTNKALIGIVVASICQLLVQLTLSTMTTYVYPNYFGNVAAQSVAGLVGTVATLGLAPFAPKLAAKFGKKELAMVGSLFGAAVFAIEYFIQLGRDQAFVYVAFYAVGYLGLSLYSLIGWAMITDVIDDTEVKTGQRSDGEIYSVYSFARKLGQAASSAVAGALLSAIGYSQATAFDEAVTQGIYNMSCLVPAIGFALLAVVLFFMYPLDKKRVEENVKILAAKAK